MKNTPSRTPSLLVEKQQEQTDILDDIAIAAPRASLVNSNKHTKLLSIVILFIIIALAFYLASKMMTWQGGEKEVNKPESMMFVTAPDSQHQDKTEKNVATISPSLLVSANHGSSAIKKPHTLISKETPNSSNHVRKDIDQVSLINISALEQAMLPHAEEGLLTELLGFVRKNNSKGTVSNSVDAAQYKDIKNLNACPAANTEEGMLCRQQVCLNNSGTAECAKSSSDS